MSSEFYKAFDDLVQAVQAESNPPLIRSPTGDFWYGALMSEEQQAVDDFVMKFQENVNARRHRLLCEAMDKLIEIYRAEVEK